ncbi:MAG: hypothetical protein R3F56_18610 [Planctomycetota bacterium]
MIHSPAPAPRLAGAVLAFWTAMTATVPLPGQSILRDLKLPPGTTDAGLDVQAGVAVGGVAYFAATDRFGQELWRSDGTLAGTRRVKDIRVGNLGADIRDLTAVGNRVYFSAFSDGYGRELWVSDGTPAGTRLVLDIDTTFGTSGNPFNLFAFQGKVYFSAGSTSGALWMSDGTAAGTGAIASIYPQETPVVAGGVFYFSAVATGIGWELWKSDGTSNGTVLVSDIVLGSGGSTPRDLAVAGSRVFFEADGATGTGRELWVSDGTAAGTRLVADIRPGTSPSQIGQIVAVDNSVVVFVADDGVSGAEVWRSDGTVAGTFLLRDIAPGATASSPNELIAFGGRVLFHASSPSLGDELWVTDGTVAGTQALDLNPGAASSAPRDLARALGGVVFSATHPIAGSELWVSDGTLAGTRVVTDGGPNAAGSPGGFTALGSRMVYHYSTGLPGGARPTFVSDGTLAGTHRIDPSAAADDSDPVGFVRLGNRALFGAQGEGVGAEPWITDGSSVSALDVIPGTGSTSPTGAVAWNGAIWFQGYDPVVGRGRELFVTDGTLPGTRLAVETNPTGHGNPEQLTPAGNRLFFVASTDTVAGELFVTDGTQAGTTLFDLRPGLTSNPQELTAVGNRVFLAANDGSNGIELWVSDGTQAGTRMLEINAGVASTSPRELVALAGRLFFVGSVPGAGFELCVSDGTPAGTGLFLDINPGTGNSGVASLTTAGNRLYFLARSTSSSSLQLWTSDGTTAGTRPVSNLANPDYDGAMVGTAGGRLYFVAVQRPSPSHGRELWTSDGTVAGTHEVVDLMSGAGDGPVAGSLYVIPGTEVAMFAGSDGGDGLQWWVSDGTAGNTLQLGRIGKQTGSGAVTLGDKIVLGTDLVFAGDDGILGREPWVLSLLGTDRAFASAYGLGCAGTGGRVPAIAGRGLPSLGNGAFGAELRQARPISAAALQLSAASHNLPLSATCRLLVASPFVSAPPVPTDGAGAGFTPLPVPFDSALLGCRLFGQYVVADPNGALLNVVAFSDGLLMVLGS